MSRFSGSALSGPTTSMSQWLAQNRPMTGANATTGIANMVAQQNKPATGIKYNINQAKAPNTSAASGQGINQLNTNFVNGIKQKEALSDGGRATYIGSNITDPYSAGAQGAARAGIPGSRAINYTGGTAGPINVGGATRTYGGAAGAGRVGGTNAVGYSGGGGATGNVIGSSGLGIGAVGNYGGGTSTGAGPVNAGNGQSVGTQLQSAEDAANAANETRYEQLLSLSNQVGTSDVTREQQNLQQQIGTADQRLISSGLSSSTILPSVESGLTDQSLLRQSQYADQNTLRQMGVIERATDQQPDLGLAASLAGRAGATGTAGPIGGGGSSGSGSSSASNFNANGAFPVAGPDPSQQQAQPYNSQQAMQQFYAQQQAANGQSQSVPNLLNSTANGSNLTDLNQPATDSTSVLPSDDVGASVDPNTGLPATGASGLPYTPYSAPTAGPVSSPSGETYVSGYGWTGGTVVGSDGNPVSPAIMQALQSKYPGQSASQLQYFYNNMAN